MKACNFRTSFASVNMHPIRGTHWVRCIKEFFSFLLDVQAPNSTTFHINKKMEKVFFFRYKIHGRDRYCAAYCLISIYSLNFIDNYFESAVLPSYQKAFV